MISPAESNKELIEQIQDNLNDDLANHGADYNDANL